MQSGDPKRGQRCEEQWHPELFFPKGRLSGSFQRALGVPVKGLEGSFKGAVGSFRGQSTRTQTLSVQSTQMWGIYGFYTRNRRNGFGNILCIWVLGPLGRVYSQNHYCDSWYRNCPICWYSGPLDLMTLGRSRAEPRRLKTQLQIAR